MNYATPTAELILFSPADVMVYSDGEKGELPPILPFVRNEDLTIRDVEDI